MSNYYDPCYNGTDQLWRHPLGLTYTDSVRDFCHEKSAYWTLDVVASYLPQLHGYEFLVLCFDVDGNRCSFYAREILTYPTSLSKRFPLLIYQSALDSILSMGY